jgi:hypothetical protein
VLLQVPIDKVIWAQLVTMAGGDDPVDEIDARVGMVLRLPAECGSTWAG